MAPCKRTRGGTCSRSVVLHYCTNNCPLRSPQEVFSHAPRCSLGDSELPLLPSPAGTSSSVRNYRSLSRALLSETWDAGISILRGVSCWAAVDDVVPQGQLIALLKNRGQRPQDTDRAGHHQTRAFFVAEATATSFVKAAHAASSTSGAAHGKLMWVLRLGLVVYVARPVDAESCIQRLVPKSAI